MSKPWSPPPDLSSIQDLLREADPEGHLAGGAAADEYEPEGEEFFEAIKDFRTADLLAPRIVPLLEAIWTANFSLTPATLAERRPKLVALAQQIERFFGPESKPQVRNA